MSTAIIIYNLWFSFLRAAVSFGIEMRRLDLRYELVDGYRSLSIRNKDEAQYSGERFLITLLMLSRL